MIRCVEDIKGSVTQLIVGELYLFERRLLVNDDKGTRMRGRTKRVVNEARLQQLVGGEQMGDLPHITAGWAIHSATADVKSCRIGEDRCLHGQLGSVCK